MYVKHGNSDKMIPVCVFGFILQLYMCKFELIWSTLETVGSLICSDASFSIRSSHVCCVTVCETHITTHEEITYVFSFVTTNFSANSGKTQCIKETLDPSVYHKHLQLIHMAIWTGQESDEKL